MLLFHQPKMNTTILSFTKPFTAFPTHFPPRTAQLNRRIYLVLDPVKSSDDSTNVTSGNDAAVDASTPLSTPGMPADGVQIRFKRGSRRKARQKQESSDSNGLPKQPKKVAAPKDWESMTMTEKAIELYVGEKGLLFWINKFAYASIYIIIGAWILFRFVGPALDLYQLDGPPLSPADVLKGSK